MTDNLNELSDMWIAAKQLEADATVQRRQIEDRIKSLVGVAENMEGTETVDKDLFSIKIVGRIDRKVDGDKVQELAAEFGLTEHLSSLFRWKPELNMSAWRAADEAITKPLTAAITVKTGRPFFTITRKEQ